VAWHSRKATLLLIVSDHTHRDLELLAHGAGGSSGDTPAAFKEIVFGAAVPLRRAHLLHVPPEGDFAPDRLARTVEDLCQRYDYVLVQLHSDGPTELPGRRLYLGDNQAAGPVPTAEQPAYLLRAWAPGAAAQRPDREGVLRIPPLDAADTRALRDGLLPAGSVAGRALGWAARHVARLKVGLALGAGSVKGYAHFGVLRVLERIGLPIDYLSGTSVGAIVATLCALGYNAEQGARLMEATSGKAFRPTLPIRGLLSSAGVRANFRQFAGNTRFEELDVPLAVVAADLMTGREVVFRRGLLRTAVLASIALPGVYPPVRIGPYTLVDGGILNPVPSTVAAEMGADAVIAVNLGGGEARPPVDGEATEEGGQLPWVLQVITRSVDVMQSKITTDTAAAATILIEPRIDTIGAMGLRSFNQGRPYIALGEQAAEAALPRIAAALPWTRA
jgi:NTE family protein